MKKLILLLLILILIAGVVLWEQGKDTREIRTEIDIAAPPLKVWKLLVDINRWDEWSPIINQSTGIASLGAILEITMIGKEEGEDGPLYHPTITALDAPSYFRWRAFMMTGWLMTNDKIFELKETSTGIHLVHIEAFSGMMVPIFWSKLNKHVPIMLNSMNEALKNLAEKGSNQSNGTD